MSGAPALDRTVRAGAGEVGKADQVGDSPALTQDAAQTKAAKSGDPVEVLSLRDERSTTVANPDGTFTVKQYVQPVRTRKNGKWAAIDTTLVKRSNGSYAPRAALSAMSFSGGGDTTFAEIEKDGRSFALDWLHELPKPEIDGSTATYKNVLDGVDLKVTASAEGFSHVLVVKSAKAAANPELAQLELPVDSTAVELNDAVGGGLTVTDSGSGGTVFEAPQPLMWDSSHENGADDGAKSSPSPSAEAAGDTETVTPPDGAQVADVAVGLAPDSMTLTPDAGLLTGKDTVFPVYIDPVIKTANRSSWAMVSSHWSSNSYWKFDDDEGVGRCPSDVSFRCASNDDVKRQFFAIPTGTFEGKDIVDAEFAVTMVFTYSDSAREAQLARVNSSGASAISSSTNWSNQPSSKGTVDSKSPTNPAGSCTSTNQNVRFDAKSTIQKAADSGWDTTTFRLKAASESDTSYWKRFCGNAYVSVTYNRPPLEPDMDELEMAPGGSCEYGKATEHYVTEAPHVTAVVKDYDHNDVKGNSETLQAKFKVWWTNSSGAEVVHYATTGKQSTTGKGSTGQAVFKYTIGSDLTGDGEAGFSIPQNTTIAWAVQGYDQTAWGPWSTDGDQTRCEFIYDTSKPKSAVITSSRYPDDDAWHAGTGDYGAFTMDSPSTDVTKYKYYFTGPHAVNTPVTVNAESTGGPATIRWMPPSEGPYFLHVTAIDGAGNPQTTPTTHTFLVSDGRAPVAGWTLGDAKGASSAAGSNGAPNAAVGSGVTFGVQGPLGSTDTAASFDGTASAYLDSGKSAVDTGSTFSISAWVMLPSLPAENMTVVSQDGTAQPGFELGYDAVSASWTFRIPVSDMDSLGTWKVSGAAAVPGSWTHLIGVYDAELATMMLYVNGVLVADDVQARHSTWSATGGVQIGRKLSLNGYTTFLKGSVADVKLHDRVIPVTEGQELGGIQPHQLAYWQLDAATSGVSPETGGDTGLTLGGGASIYLPDDSCDPELDPDCVPPAEPLWGDGHLALNGTSAYATRAAGLLSAEDSFTLTARARLAAVNPSGNETVLSLSGTNNSAITVKYLAASNRWQLGVTGADTSAPVTTTVLDNGDLPSLEGDGDHLALVYNAVFGDVLLYVNGVAVAEAPWDNTWDFSKTGLQVGRTLTGSTASEYFSGAIDEVRMYQGPLDASLVTLVAVMPAGASIDETSA
ncbi:LamG-like jellyroll fold domain-containing protein [Streptomyces sp. NPDC096311]|uniref:LamG-like jellyroll fold domain-containing protein n=1 Tax=Streptomyces sp. NPDC096311 TaxID=3366083 RepID=UPI00381BE7AF